MSSRLQLDIRNLSLRRRRVVNVYEVKAGIGVIAGKTVWSMPERLECEVGLLRYNTKIALYKYMYLFRFFIYYFTSNWLHASPEFWTRKNYNQNGTIIKKLSCRREPCVLYVIEYIAKSRNVTHGYSKWHCWTGRVSPYYKYSTVTNTLDLSALAHWQYNMSISMSVINLYSASPQKP